MEKLFAWDKREGQVVYRIPGHQHGDGQIDSDEFHLQTLNFRRVSHDSGEQRRRDQQCPGYAVRQAW